ncbi:hypothetical protein R3P38DRAFT_2722947 [Favolaschia claudopus]|uniref:DUF6535 domain-containing protein n=1 Tax=Favolaschia claudopus TaxID=2862362 RepID=A0AAW0AJS2_9AGAR
MERAKLPEIPKVLDSGDDGAAAKLWSIYLSQAEKYDKALVESWKSDMDGLLIFAGLFSAILSAFLVESYKTLNADPGDATVQLLTQISRQLATSEPANRSVFTPSSTPFSAGTPALICNSLWFISLTLSLSCAMLATLVQQWSREFLHRAEMRSAPVVRARIFSYLYYGLKRFRMHTVVELIPLLIHTSLFLFLCGLIAFLIPVNLLMTIIPAINLLLIAIVYSAFTLLPLGYPDCPYRTPVSSASFSILRVCKAYWKQCTLWMSKSAKEYKTSLAPKIVVQVSKNMSLKQAMCRAAISPCSERDHKALLWTVNSLVDEIQLEPLAEVIPSLLWGARQRRNTYEGQILRLVHLPEVQLHTRIAALLDGCNTGVLSSGDSMRRRITCFKALWSIAALSKFSRLPSESITTGVDFAHIYAHLAFGSSDPTATHWVSAVTMMRWSTFCSVYDQLLDLHKHLETYQSAGEVTKPVNSTLVALSVSIHDLYAKFRGLAPVEETSLPAIAVPRLRQMVASLLGLPHTILFRYLAQAVVLGSTCFRWHETRSAILVDPSVQFSLFQTELRSCLNIISSYALGAQKKAPVAVIDTSLSALLSFWRPETCIPIPRSIIAILNGLKPDARLQHVLRAGGDIIQHLWMNASATLLESSQFRESNLTAIWRLASITVKSHAPESIRFQDILQTITQFEPSFPHIVNSLVPLIKLCIVFGQPENPSRPDWTESALLGAVENPVYPQESTVVVEAAVNASTLLMGLEKADDKLSDAELKKLVSDCVIHRKAETRVAILADYLLQCASGELPYNAIATLEQIASLRAVPYRKAIHRAHQIRFAESVHSILSTGVASDMSIAVVNASFWTLDCAAGNMTSKSDLNGPLNWVDNLAARKKIKEGLAAYSLTLKTSKTEQNSVLRRLHTIQDGLDS